MFLKILHNLKLQIFSGKYLDSFNYVPLFKNVDFMVLGIFLLRLSLTITITNK